MLQWIATAILGVFTAAILCLLIGLALFCYVGLLHFMSGEHERIAPSTDMQDFAAVNICTFIATVGFGTCVWKTVVLMVEIVNYLGF